MSSIEKLQNIDWWREKCLTDLYFLCRVVLQTIESPTPGYKDLYKPTHKHITDFVQNNTKPEQRLLILCPRGWIKSYIITVGYTIQRILNNLVKKLGDTILISNATLTNSQMFLSKIKYNFQFNELLRSLFPEIPKEPDKQAERWTINEIKLGNTLVETGSVEGNLVSKHYTLMINDDLVNRENSATKEQLVKVIDWWKLARSLLESFGTEIDIGTRWYADDLYGYFLKEFLGLSEDDFKEHRKQPFTEIHKGEYHYLRYACWQDPVEEKGSTFPTLFPEEKLKKIQKEQAEFFDGQMLNDPFAMQQNFVKSNWIQYWRRGEKPETTLSYLLLDPAGKETAGSDNSGMVVVEAGSDRKYYVVYAQRKKESDMKVVEWLIEVASYYQPILIGIEENKFEIYRELLHFLIPQMISMGKIAKGSNEYVYTLENLVVPLRHRNRPKELRVKNLQGWIESGNMLFAQTGMSALLDEIFRFGKTTHDDIVDALAYILDVGVFPEKETQKIFLGDEHKTPEELEQECWERQPESNFYEPVSNLLGEID